MAISPKELFEQSLALEERERADLASWILESLEPVDADAESAWAEEIKRRMEELESGGVTTVPWEELRAKLSRKLESIG
jgi:putative addiction module component (TIGR02574 family)